MTREEELAQLIAEQKADDTHIVYTPRPKFVTLTSLDRQVNESSSGHGVMGDEMYVGVEYDFDTMIETGDYELQGEHVVFLGRNAAHRGYSMRKVPHGTYNGANNYGCRCEPCKQAYNKYNREHMRKWKAQKRRQEMAIRPAIACACCGKRFVPWRTTKLYCTSRCTERACARRRRGLPISDAEFKDKRFRENRAA